MRPIQQFISTEMPNEEGNAAALENDAMGWRN